MWNNTWGGSLDDEGVGVVVDTVGNAYCIGVTESFGAALDDFAQIKFDTPKASSAVPGYDFITNIFSLIALISLITISYTNRKLITQNF